MPPEVGTPFAVLLLHGVLDPLTPRVAQSIRAFLKRALG
jgi:hypothetical protein